MRIHTGFHRFTEIIKLSKLTSGKWCGKMFCFYNFRELNAPSMNQKPRKENSTKIPGVACPGAPIETCSFAPSFRKSFSIKNLTVFILDARLRIFRRPCKDENKGKTFLLCGLNFGATELKRAILSQGEGKG